MKLYPNSDDEPIVDKLSDIDLTGFYSYENYLRWEINERLELIRGKIYEMGASSTSHQRVCGAIFYHVYSYLKKEHCEVFVAPFDVRLSHDSTADDAVMTVVQPDICVVCDSSKIDTRGCMGAPDIVVEILSPENNKKELNIKYHLYEEFGIKEYWIVHPGKCSIIKYALNNSGKYDVEGQFENRDKFSSGLLPGFELDLSEVFKS